jgi:hypothetical protein
MIEEDEIEELRFAIESKLAGRRNMTHNEYDRGMLDAIAIILGDDEELLQEILEG